MALLLEHRQAPSAPLTSLYGDDVQTWTSGQVALNDEIQRIIAQAHRDKECDWDDILANIATAVKQNPALYHESFETMQPSCEKGPEDLSSGYHSASSSQGPCIMLKRKRSELSFDRSSEALSDDHACFSRKRQRNTSYRRVKRLRAKVKKNHNTLVLGNVVGSYRPKYAIGDMDEPYVGICTGLKEASDLQIQLSVMVSTTEDAAAKRLVLKEIRDWDVNGIIDKLDLYMAQLRNTLLQCDRETSDRQYAQTCRSQSSVKLSLIDDIGPEPPTSPHLHRSLANQERVREAGSSDSDSEGHGMEDDLAEHLASSTLSGAHCDRQLPLNKSQSTVFTCSLCSRRFNRQEHLKRHCQSLHTHDKPFKCDTCDKRFSRSDNLAQHRRVCET